ncbi:IS110 family transposase [Solidesulfovibrio sp. C21]|uniref:IS110 family transposase n=1 Tax=Solidesulfovibrio sp. C21 TaxID=3398613 RepID=UPI0039FBCEFA
MSKRRWGAKTDRLDCVKLADYAAKGMLRPIAVPTEEQEAQRSLERRRHDLADDLCRVKQLKVFGRGERERGTLFSKRVPLSHLLSSLILPA